MTLEIPTLYKDRVLEHDPTHNVIRYIVPHISMQQKNGDCWDCATRMIYAFFGIPYPKITHKYDTSLHYGLSHGSEDEQIHFQGAGLIKLNRDGTPENIYNMLVKFGPLYCSADGHVVVITGVKNGQIYINNPWFTADLTFFYTQRMFSCLAPAICNMGGLIDIMLGCGGNLLDLLVKEGVFEDSDVSLLRSPSDPSEEANAAIELAIVKGFSTILTTIRERTFSCEFFNSCFSYHPMALDPERLERELKVRAQVTSTINEHKEKTVIPLAASRSSEEIKPKLDVKELLELELQEPGQSAYSQLKLLVELKLLEPSADQKNQGEILYKFLRYICSNIRNNLPNPVYLALGSMQCDYRFSLFNQQSRAQVFRVANEIYEHTEGGKNKQPLTLKL
jgi:hypothetical protein